MPWGSSARLDGRNAAISDGERFRCSHRFFAVPMPCSALIEPPCGPRGRAPRRRRVVVGPDARDVDVHVAVADVTEQPDRGRRRDRRSPQSAPVDELGERAERQGHVELVWWAERVDGQRVQLAVRPQLLATRCDRARPPRRGLRRAVRVLAASASVGSRWSVASSRTYTGCAAVNGGRQPIASRTPAACRRRRTARLRSATRGIGARWTTRSTAVAMSSNATRATTTLVVAGHQPESGLR